MATEVVPPITFTVNHYFDLDQTMNDWELTYYTEFSAYKIYCMSMERSGENSWYHYIITKDGSTRNPSYPNLKNAKDEVVV